MRRLYDSYPRKSKPVGGSMPLGMRRELAATIFDLILDGASRDDAETRVRAVATSEHEAIAALARFDRAVRVCGMGVTL